MVEFDPMTSLFPLYWNTAMTTRLLFVALVFFLFALPAVGQSAEPLSTLQSQEYKQKSLAVDLSGLQVSDSSGDVLEIGCTICWVPYRGYERLSERSFFEIAGQDRLAREVQRSRRNKYIAMGLGGLSMIAGAVLLSNNFPKREFENPKVGQVFLGGLLIGGGGAAVSFSALKLRARSIPYTIAQDVAFQYNNQLQEELGLARP